MVFIFRGDLTPALSTPWRGRKDSDIDNVEIVFERGLNLKL